MRLKWQVRNKPSCKQLLLPPQSAEQWTWQCCWGLAGSSLRSWSCWLRWLSHIHKVDWALVVDRNSSAVSAFSVVSWSAHQTQNIGVTRAVNSKLRLRMQISRVAEDRQLPNGTWLLWASPLQQVNQQKLMSLVLWSLPAQIYVSYLRISHLKHVLC